MHGFMRWNKRLAQSTLRHYLSKATVCKIYGDAVKSHHTAANFAVDSRSYRGRSDPSKRVSDIHAYVQTHPGPVTRNMRTRRCVGRAWRPPVRRGCACINTLSTTTRRPNQLGISKSSFTSLMLRQIKKKNHLDGNSSFWRPKLIELREFGRNNIYPMELITYYRRMRSNFTNGICKFYQNNTGTIVVTRITPGYVIFI